MRRLLPLPVGLLWLLCACSSPPEPAVILISIDGFRWDYFDDADTPNLDRLIAGGVKAESLAPVFPSNTFPNHYAIVTGRYSENHGIVDNVFYDPTFDAEFGFFVPSTFREGRWWEAEPLWITVERQGKTSAAMFWVGTDAEIAGMRPSYWQPYDGTVPNEERVDTVLGYFDLPRDERPAFTTLYMSHVDDAGHRAFPGGAQTVAAVEEADRIVGRLIAGLESRELFDAVHIVVVSDHGMTPTSGERVIFLDDYVDLEKLDFVRGGAVAHLWPRADALDDVYERLAGAHPHLHVFRKDEIPGRFHYREHRRVPPILATVDEGWLVMGGRDPGWPTGVGMGGHGYDPELPSMQGIFVAHGPRFRRGVVVDAFANIHVYELLSEILDVTPAANDGSLDAVRHLLVD